MTKKLKRKIRLKQMAEASRRWRAAHLEQSKAIKRRWGEAHPNYQREWQQKNPEYGVLYRHLYPQTFRECEKNWRLANPEKVRAHQILRLAIRSGKLTRQPCQVCCATPSDGHHEDYARPLEVTWLCRLHHKETHRRDIAQKASR